MELGLGGRYQTHKDAWTETHFHDRPERKSVIIQNILLRHMARHMFQAGSNQIRYMCRGMKRGGDAKSNSSSASGSPTELSNKGEEHDLTSQRDERHLLESLELVETNGSSFRTAHHAWRQLRFAMPGMFAWDDHEDYETILQGETMSGSNVAGHMEAHALI